MRPTGVVIWRKIAETLETDIERGDLAPGAQLPFEAALAERFSVNRHTVRQALAALKERGLISVIAGRGAFVRPRPISYPIGRRTRFTDTIGGTSRHVESKALRSWQEPATERIAADLEIPLGSPLVAIEDLRVVDGLPLTITVHYFPLPRFAGMPVLFERTGSITLALKELGEADYLRRLTRVHARGANVDESIALGCSPGTPVLVAEIVNTDMDGKPIEYGCGRSIGERMEFVFRNQD